MTLAKGFRTSFSFQAVSTQVSDEYLLGSQGITLYYGPSRGDSGGGPGRGFPLMYPPPESRPIPGALDIMFSTSSNPLTTREPQVEKVAIYLNRIIEWRLAVCSKFVDPGTFTNGDLVQVLIQFLPANVPSNPLENASLAIWWWPRQSQQAAVPNMYCSSAALTEFAQNWKTMTDSSPAQLGLLSSTLPQVPGEEEPPVSENGVTTLFMEFCEQPYSYYQDPAGPGNSACLCLPGYTADAAGLNCLPTSSSSTLSAGAVAGIVIGSLVGLAAIGGALFWVTRSKRKEAVAAAGESATALATAAAEAGTNGQIMEMDAPLNALAASAPPLSALENELDALVSSDGAALVPTPTRSTAIQPSAPPDHEALIGTGAPLGAAAIVAAPSNLVATPSSSGLPMAPPRTVSAPAGIVDPHVVENPPPPYTEMDPHGHGPVNEVAAVPGTAPPTVAAETMTPLTVAAPTLAVVGLNPSPTTQQPSIPTVVAPPRASSSAAASNDGAVLGATDLPKPLHMIAIKAFTGTRNDEINLSVGDILAVRRVFDDGWAFGTNHSMDSGANNNGYFPLAAAKMLAGDEAMASYLSPSAPSSG